MVPYIAKKTVHYIINGFRACTCFQKQYNNFNVTTQGST